MKNSNRNTANTHEELTLLSRLYEELIEAFDEVSTIFDRQLKQSRKRRSWRFPCSRFPGKKETE
jgi:hypothetical protein